MEPSVLDIVPGFEPFLDEEESLPPEPFGDGAPFWNARYERDPQPYDWLEDYVNVQPLIEALTGGDRAARVLHPGCGNSLVPERMYDDGYEHIVNIDSSSVVINQMLERNAARESLEWRVMDATKMSFANASFDLVLDKSLLDTFACMENSTNVSALYLQEVARVLKPGGALLCISFGEAQARLPFFSGSGVGWSVNPVELEQWYEGPAPNMAYIARLAEAAEVM